MPRKRNNKIFMVFRIIGLFIVGLIVAVFVALNQVNLETLRGSVLGILREATGMPVEINGTVSWRFSMRPRIQLYQVRIPNAEWAHSEYAFSAERIDVTINLLSLFQDRPTIQNIRVYDANVHIEQNSKGEYSIGDIIQKREKDVAANAKKLPENTCDSARPNKFPFEDPGLGGIEIRKLNAEISGEKYSIAGFNIRYFPHLDRREYGGWIRSETHVYPFIVSFSEYNEENAVYPVSVALSTGGEALIANLALNKDTMTPKEFHIKGDIPNMAEFGDVFGRTWPEMPAVSLDVTGATDWHKISFEKSSINTKGIKIVFSGQYNWSKAVPDINFNIEADKISLPELFPEMYAHTWTRPNRELNVFKDTPLYGKELRGHNIKLNLKLGQFIVYRDFNIKKLDVAARLQGGALKLTGSAQIGGGTVNVAADADIDKDGVMDVVAAGVANDVSVGKILEQIRMSDFITGLSVDAKVFLRGRGATLSELMATTTGPVQVYSVAPGWIHSTLIADVYGADFLTSLRHSIEDMFRSEKQHNQIEISCLSVNAKLRDGVIETQHGVAVETNAMNLRLAGNVDLGSETMKMSLTTVPVRGLKLSLTGNLVNSMEITGNLAEPDVKINGVAVAGKVASATGLGLLLAPFTGGLGLVAGAGVGLLAGDLLENWLADDSPCETAMKRGAPAKRDDAEWINQPLDDLVGGMLNK